jgi:hypothetical protein
MGSHVDAIIRAAIERGELDNLPHHGEPLNLDEDRDVPPELRMTHRILKNAGYVPAEVEEMHAIAALRQELQAAECPDEQQRIQREIQKRQALLATRLERIRGA